MNEVASSYGLALFSLSKEQNLVLERQNEVKALMSVLKENAGYIMERSIDSHIDWWPFKDYQILEHCEAGIDYE